LVLCCCTCRADARTNADALVVLLPREVEEIDPRLTGDAYGHKLSRLLFGSLVTIDPDSLRMVPDLATQVEIVSPTGYRVHLRHGLHFSDGSTLDADDVIATFRGVVDPKLGSRYASTYARIAEMEAEDPWTVVFRLRGPHATFLSDLELPIVRAEDAARAMGGAGGAPLIGAGPYVLEQRTSGRIELSANAYWYGGEPRYKAVRFLVVHDDNTRALRLLAGKGDLALNAVPPLLLPLFERDPRFSVHSAHGVGTTYVGLNLEAPALRDVRVRRAIAHAIDREALIRAKLAGRAQLATSWIVPGHWAYADHVAHYDYDPQRARALLRSVKGQDASGPPIHLSLRCGSDRFRQSLAHAIAAMLRDVGLEVDVRPSEVATLIANLNRGRFELTTLEVPEVVEPHVLSWFFGSDHVPGTGNEGANRWRLRSAALDAALERGRAHVEPEIRIAAYADAQRILAEELPVIPLWHEDVVAVEDARARAFHVARLGRFNPLAR
jgi:peptide/nickel transport system substrate-binding protein